MKKYRIIRQILLILVVLFGISFFTFLLTYLTPGDPVRTMFLASGSMPSNEVIEATRAEMGLDKPFLVQYLNWLGGVLHGDLGVSYTISAGEPVLSILSSRLWPTLWLALLSLVLMLAVAVPFGMLAAVKQNKPIDYIVRGCTFVGISLPSFWVGLMLIYVVALKLGLLPVISTDTGFKKMILPAITLAFSMSAKYTRQVRATVLEELHKDYVVGARARGMKKTTILWKHVFPNALLPLVTLLGLSLGSLLGGTAVVEVIFSYPGLGSLAVQAVKAMDYPVIQGYVLWIALIYMVINLLVDISYGSLDPRIKRG
ncbi:MAG: ABC transporter permease [Lachnospiraceae bacterium]|jgi:peptide/nickel transport system permease protein|nr:ABC transporter permease [Lachnospiraceae bacterium]